MSKEHSYAFECGYQMGLAHGRAEHEPIVRCRDCLHVSYDGVLSTGWCNENCREVRPDGFCAWGERRDEQC